MGQLALEIVEFWGVVGMGRTLAILWLEVDGGAGAAYSPRFMVAYRGRGFKGGFWPPHIGSVGRSRGDAGRIEHNT